MSNVPNLRFKEFSGEWEEKTLGHLIKSLDAGVSVNSTDQVAKDGEKAILKTSCVSYGTFNINENKLVFEKNEISRLKESVKSNTIIISRMNTPALVGANAFVKYDNENIFLPDRLWAGKVKNTASPEWTAILMSSSKIRTLLSARATGTSNSMKNITKGDVLTLPIVVPSKQEQEKIASFLTSVDTKIEQLTKKEELLQQYKKGVMQKIFNYENRKAKDNCLSLVDSEPKAMCGSTAGGIRFQADDGSKFCDWEEKKLDEIGIVITGKTPSTANAELWDGNIEFITPTDIKDFKYQTRTARTVTEKSNMKILPVGSIIYTCIASIGKMSLSTLPSITNQQINSLIVNNKKYNNEFVYYALLELTPYIKSTQANTTLPIINKTEFSRFSINVPCLEEQTKIANFLSSIDTKIEQVQKQLDSTKEFKKALLQQMFV